MNQWRLRMIKGFRRPQERNVLVPVGYWYWPSVVLVQSQCGPGPVWYWYRPGKVIFPAQCGPGPVRYWYCPSAVPAQCGPGPVRYWYSPSVVLVLARYGTVPARYLCVLDLQAAVVQQRHAGVLPQQGGAVLQPGDGGLGVPGRQAAQHRRAAHRLRLVGRALPDDGRGAVLGGWNTEDQS